MYCGMPHRQNIGLNLTPKHENRALSPSSSLEYIAGCIYNDMEGKLPELKK